MRIIALLVMVFGVALGVGAIFFASKYFEGMKASMVQKPPDTVRVLVAKQGLPYGTRIQPDHLQWVEWPRAAVPAGAFTAVDKLLGPSGKEKRIVVRTIEPGEPILEAKLTKAGESLRMAMNLSEGMRAVSIPIDVVAGVAGFVAPGDRVDILLTRTQQGQLTSSVILQDITIIAVDQNANQEGGGARTGSTVTVEVDTKNAQKLALAMQIGRLSLTLRGVGESVDEEALKPVTASELSDLEVAAPVAVQAAPQVRVRRGLSVTSVNVSTGAETGPGTTEDPPADADKQPAASN